MFEKTGICSQGEIFDLSLPSVLLHPQCWRQSARPEDFWIIPLEIAVLEPGVLRECFERVRRSNFAWRVTPELFAEAPRATTQRAIRRAQAQQLIGENPKFIGEAKEASTYQRIFALATLPTMIPIAHGAPATLLDWVTAIAPDLSKVFPVEARSQWWSREPKGLTFWLKAYRKQFPEAAQFPWEGLRFFGGFLRTQKVVEAAQIFEIAWARFQALFSSQDEISEQKSLRTDQLMLNPTAQIIKRATDSLRSITVFVRSGSSVKEIQIKPIAAAIIDELQENPRITHAHLLAHLNAAMKPLFANENFAPAIQELIDTSVLLQGPPCEFS